MVKKAFSNKSRLKGREWGCNSAKCTSANSAQAAGCNCRRDVAVALILDYLKTEFTAYCSIPILSSILALLPLQGCINASSCRREIMRNLQPEENGIVSEVVMGLSRYKIHLICGFCKLILSLYYQTSEVSVCLY